MLGLSDISLAESASASPASDGAVTSGTSRSAEERSWRISGDVLDLLDQRCGAPVVLDPRVGEDSSLALRGIYVYEQFVPISVSSNQNSSKALTH